MPFARNYIGRQYGMKAGVLEILFMFLNPRCRYIVKIYIQIYLLNLHLIT